MQHRVTYTFKWVGVLRCVRDFHGSYNILQRYKETYYEILKLRPDCTTKEIRDAFVKLSKEYHPDAKGNKSNPKHTAEFVKITEAYQTLSKPTLRREYDQIMAYGNPVRTPIRKSHRRSHAAEFYRPWDVHPNYGPNEGSYYGIRGINKVSNIKVALLLTLAGVFCALLGIIIIRYSFAFNLRQLDRKSTAANEQYSAVRANALKYSKEEQLQRMVDKMSAKEESEHK